MLYCVGESGSAMFSLGSQNHTWPHYTVMAMNISYNWLFQWDEIHSINGMTS